MRRDSVRGDSIRSVYERSAADSVVVRDSTVVREGGDTVYVLRYRNVYRDRVRNRVDTVYAVSRAFERSSVEHQSNNNDVRVVERRYIPPWCWVVLALTCLLALYWLVRLIIYLRKRFGY